MSIRIIPSNGAFTGTGCGDNRVPMVLCGTRAGADRWWASPCRPAPSLFSDTDGDLDAQVRLRSVEVQVVAVTGDHLSTGPDSRLTIGLVDIGVMDLDDAAVRLCSGAVSANERHGRVRLRCYGTAVTRRRHRRGRCLSSPRTDTGTMVSFVRYAERPRSSRGPLTTAHDFAEGLRAEGMPM